MRFLIPLLLICLIGLAFLVLSYDSPQRQKLKAERLKARRIEKEKELDTLRTECARLNELLGQIQGEAQDEIIVSNNVFAHQVLDTIRKEK